jgi:hypothetical protein
MFLFANLVVRTTPLWLLHHAVPLNTPKDAGLDGAGH